MGYNLKMLAERNVDQTLYYDHACHMELRELIHDHVEDFRMVYDREDFLALSDHWIEARRKYDSLGQPEPDEQNDLLSKKVLTGKRQHHERTALEFTRGGADKDGGGDTIHFHYRHCRIHLTKCDFYRLSQLFSEALKAYCSEYSEVISLSDPNVVVRPIVSKMFSPWLLEYINGEHPKANPDEYWDLYLEVKKAIRPAEEQRPGKGGWLEGQPRTRYIPDDLNKRYLFSMYESMKKYGYAEGPFKYDFMRAILCSDGKIEVTGSHRCACLLALGVDSIPVVVTN